MNELTNTNHHRGIADVTRDIRIKTGQFLLDAIEIGRLLFEAKAMVEPGGWSRYIEEELPFSHSWANNYMRLYKELGGEQISLFDDSQAFANLRPTQALELLALPAGERQEFVETHDVENMSTRELRQAIKDLEEAKADLQETEADLDAEVKRRVAKENDLADAERKIEDLQARVEAAERASKAAEESKRKIVKQMEENLDKLELAQAAEAKAKAALKKAQENPDIPESVMEQLRREAEASAAEAAAEEIRKKLATAEAALQEANRAKMDAEAREKDAKDKLSAAQTSAKIQNPNLMAINVLGKQTILTAWNTVQGHRLKAIEADPANAEPIDSFLVKVLCTLIRSVDGLWEKLQNAMADE